MAGSSDGPRVVLVDSVSAAVAVDRPRSTIRGWAHQGFIVRKGSDARGRALYDLAEVFAVAQRLAGPSRGTIKHGRYGGMSGTGTK